MYGLAVNLSMSVSGHPSIIDKIFYFLKLCKHLLKIKFLLVHSILRQNQAVVLYSHFRNSTTHLTLVYTRLYGTLPILAHLTCD